MCITYSPRSTKSINPLIKKRKLAEVEDAQNDYRAALNRFAASHVTQNEYLQTPPPARPDTLAWWKQHHAMFPHLSRMARDTFAVPATGAGVEREFSKSGRIATWSRALLKPDTICEMMRYKEYLSRTGQPLTPRKRGEEIYDHEKTKEAAEGDIDEEAEEAEDEEDKIRRLEWEQEW